MASMSFDKGSIKRIVIESCRGDVDIEGGDQEQIELKGDRSLSGRVVEQGSDLVIRGHSSDLRLAVATDTAISARRISGEVKISHVGEVDLAHVAGDLKLEDVGATRVEATGGDLDLNAGESAADIGRIGGDLEIESVGALTVGLVGGDLSVVNSSGAVSVGRVGGDIALANATSVQLGGVGGDAALANIQQLLGLGHVGGDLRVELGATLSADVHGVVGGDAQITLPADANLVLRAIVGGDITADGLNPAPVGESHEAEDWAATEEGGSEQGWDSLSGGELVVTYGEGGPELQLTIGGDLELHGGKVTSSTFAPHVTASIGGFDFGIGEEMRRFAREMKAMAREVAREMRTVATVPGSRPRFHVQVNDKAFHFDAEQIDRITREAREAAAEGVARAQEAVERALVNIVSGGRGVVPPRPPVPPRAPYAARPARPATPARPGFTGQTVRIEREPAAPARSEEEIREEKLAILRMVSEGRLGIDEAEVMLRALEQRS